MPKRSSKAPGLSADFNVAYSSRQSDDMTDVNSASRDVLEQIKISLSQSQLDVSSIHAQNFEWLAPVEAVYQNAQSLAAYQSKTLRDHGVSRILRRFREHPTTVTNEELSTILNLDVSTEQSPSMPPGDHYYMRSWIFTADKLLAVIAYMKDDMSFSEETRNWKLTVDQHRQDIAYVGTVAGPLRPFDRYQDDFSKRPTGLLAEFSRAIKAISPEIEIAAEIFLIRDASVTNKERQIFEDVERVLIDFMGFDTLLNRQRGGSLVSYVPSIEDGEAFASLATDVGNAFRLRSVPPPSGLESEISQHFQRLQKFVKENPEVCGKRAISTQLREVLQEQATPQQYKGVTLVTFVGKDIPIEKFLKPAHFLDEDSQSGDFMRQIFQRIALSEALYQGRPPPSDDSMIYRDLYCCCDLWPWLKHNELEFAVRYLTKYLQLVKPLIAPVFGLVTNDLVMNNFDTTADAKLTAITPAVALPTIQYYDCPAAGQPHDANSAFILIPCLDPGREKYGSEVQLPFRRLVDISMKYVVHVLQVAMRTCDAFEELPNRLVLCQAILTNLKTSNKQAFEDILQQAKKDLQRSFQQFRSKSESDNVRSTLNGEAREILASFGRAQGAPGSDERTLQLEHMWTHNLSPLHLTIPHLERNKKIWIEQFVQLRPLQPLLFAVTADLSKDEYEIATFRILRPEWLTYGS
ncbi:hypothetical protein E4T42_05834 [Aureobasidium subglaciale]|nr:hypothetical protein E4T42_05834 [Aureobasidium subglaciale]